MTHRLHLLTSHARTRLAVLATLLAVLPLMLVGLGSADSANPPRLTLSAAHATVGATVRVAGTGFPLSARGTLTLSGTTLASLRTNSLGRFSGSVSIPPMAAGAKKLVATIGAASVTRRFVVDATGTTTPTSTGAISRDGTTSAHGGASTSAKLTTTAADDLIVAAVSSDAPQGGSQVLAVSGGGLTWSRAVRANSAPGGAEIWWARAASPLQAAAITSTQTTPTGSQLLQVVAFKNASGIGATKGYSGTTAHPSISFATSAAGSFTLAVGNDYSKPTLPTVGTGQRALGSFVDSATGDAYWAQIAGPAGASGTIVTLDAHLGGTDATNFAAVEIVAGASGVAAPAAPAAPVPPAADPAPAPAPTPPAAPAPATGDFPSASNTGYRPHLSECPGGALKKLTGDRSASSLTTAGGTISCVEITGGLNVDIANVTVTKSWIYGEVHANANGGSNHAVISDTEIGGPLGSRWGEIATGSWDYTLLRANVHGFGDGPRANGGTTIRDSYIHDLSFGPGDHNDGIQMTGDSNVVIQHNTILNANSQTSAIMIGADTGNVDNVLVDNNLVAGGGYAIYGGGTPPAGRTTTRVTITNNRFSTMYFASSGAYGALAYVQPGSVVSGNVWYDGPKAGQPIS